MSLVKRIATLNLKELAVLCKVFIKHPIYLLPTYKATNITVVISNRIYGGLHHEDNRTNAFRHALWNYMICKYCMPGAGSPEKAIRWSKKITDLHEGLCPNEELAKKMDLHNNRIGREVFLNFLDKENEVISLLQQMTKEAIQVKTVREIEEVENDLVFIERIQNS